MLLATLALFAHSATAAPAAQSAQDSLLTDRDREIMEGCWDQVMLGAATCPAADAVLTHVQAYPVDDLVRAAGDPYDSELALPITFMAMRAADRMERGDAAGAAADATFLLGLSEAALGRPRVSPDLLQASLMGSRMVTEQMVESWTGPVPAELAALLAVPPRDVKARAVAEYGACSWEAASWSQPARDHRSRRFAWDGQAGQTSKWTPLAIGKSSMVRLMNESCDRTLASRLGLAAPPSSRVTLMERVVGLSSLRGPNAMPLVTRDLFGRIAETDASRVRARSALRSGGT